MRQHEQREAAQLTHTPVIQFKYPSAASNGHMGLQKQQEVARAISSIFSATPDVARVYGHNPLDKHDTHLATLACMLSGLRAAASDTPKLAHVYGMEVWGGLTTVEPLVKKFPLSKTVLQQLKDVIAVYKSQILGQGRHYEDATDYRYRAHGAYTSSPHSSEPPNGIGLALDMTELVRDGSPDLLGYIKKIMDRARDLKMEQAKSFTIPSLSPTVTFQEKLNVPQPSFDSKER